MASEDTMVSEDYTGMDWVKSDVAWIIAGVCAFIGMMISLYNIIKHIANYTLPEQQLYIIRILFIVPLYAIVSFLSIGLPSFALYFETFRDAYEAFVIYCFLILILGYVGGEANCVSLISLKPPLKHPFPLCFLPAMPLNVKFLRFCKQSCIQFIIIKPIMGILNIIVLATGNYYKLGYQIFASAVYNISYTLALYGLLLFYLACKADIRAYSPVRKFLAIKIIVFATYWQSLAVSFAPGIPQETAELWNDFILCLEMSIFAVLHLYSFPWWEFRTGMPSSSELVAQNAKKVLSFKDVVRDVYHNIAPAYQTYVLQTNDGTVREYKTKTYMVGNLNDPKVHNKFLPNFNGLRKKYGLNNKKKNKGNAQYLSNKNKYIIHTDEYDDSHFDQTETELEYDDRIRYNGDNDHDSTNDTNNDDEEEQEEEDENGLAVVKKKKNDKKNNRNDNNTIDAEEIFDDFGDINDITPRISKEDNNNKSKSISTVDSTTNLMNHSADNNDNNNDNQYVTINLSQTSIHSQPMDDNNSEDGDDESESLNNDNHQLHIT